MTYLFPYILTLEAPAIFTQVGGDPNSSFSLDYIPGSALRGAVAGRLGDPLGDQTALDEFHDLVLSGTVCYLNAYPIDSGKRRAIPTPASLKRKKHGRFDGQRNEPVDLIDLSYSPTANDWPDDQLTSIGTRFVHATSGNYHSARVKTFARVHHQRNRSKGHATKESGAIFTYEALESGQEFKGFIAINAAEGDAHRILSRIQSLLGTTLNLGRSRHAGYGGNIKLTIETLPVNREFEDAPALRTDVEAGCLFRVLLLSEYIGRNPGTGQIDPTSFAGYLEEALQNRAVVANQVAGYSMAGGYNRKARLRLPQTATMAAGSILILKANKRIPFDDLKNVEAPGLGERQTEGFGRFVFLSKPVEVATLLEPVERNKASAPQPPKDKLAVELLKLMQRRLMDNQIDLVIDGYVRKTVLKESRISTSLAGRLRVPLRQNPDQALEILRTWLHPEKEAHGLRKFAMDQIDRCKLVKGQTLREWLVNITESDGSKELFTDLANESYLLSKKDALAVLGEQSSSLKVRLIDAVLAELSRQARMRSKEGESRGNHETPSR